MSRTVSRLSLICWLTLAFLFAHQSAVADVKINPDNWTRFRGPDGSAIGQGKSVPTRWSPTSNIRWKRELPGFGASSAITIGTRIYVTCFSGYALSTRNPGDMNQLKRHVVCLQQKDGEILWTSDVETVLPEEPYQRRMHWHGYASNTPAADEQRVYAFFGKSGVVALDHDGNQLWQTDVGSQHNGWGSGTSLVLYKNMVIVNASVESGSILALDKKTGREVWRTGNIQESWNTPILVKPVGGKTELIVAVFGKIFGLDPDTGKELWNCRGINNYMAPSMVEHAGVIFCTAGRQRETVAVRAGGRGDVSGTHELWRQKRGSNVSSPVYHNGYLYWAHDSQGIVYCVDAKTGELQYEERLRPRPSNIYASPVIADGKLFYLSRYGATYVLPAEPKFEILAHNSLAPDKGFNASPTVSQGDLLLRSDRFLYCIGEK